MWPLPIASVLPVGKACSRRWFVTAITSVGGARVGLPARPGNGPQGRRLGPGAGPRQRDPRRAVLLLHGRPHVADPRRLHDVRDRHRAAQERARHGDEEHPHDRRRHADLLLLRLVDLQLQPGRPADRPQQRGLHQRRLSGRHPLVGRVRAEPDQQHQPRLLPRLPALLVDDGVDHVGRAARAGAAVGVPRARRPARLGRLDPGRRLGLERRRLDDAALRVPRLDRVRGRARSERRLHAWRALQPRPTDRQIHEGRSELASSDLTTCI